MAIESFGKRIIRRAPLGLNTEARCSYHAWRPVNGRVGYVYMFSYASLKSIQRATRSDFQPGLSLRTHRALSWLSRAEREHEDDDARFLFLWIAFNAAYANDFHDRKSLTERKMLLHFLGRLVEMDRERLLYQIVWNEFPNSIRLLLQNRYVFQPFWDFHAGLIEEADWRAAFDRSRKSASRALGRTDTKRVLAEVFDRLYTLRNQIVHGGATWNSSVNRAQLKDAAGILGQLVPTIIHVMMENPHQLWGDPCYPVVD